ncbi:hypothetical protein [Microbacterium elymi]|uniref:Uncharacterized protein n=1 Tax=Microbacterium elymi TaxID=2909587 RepID=A0ABY5NL65_9MICO|nr:hypothetical protein [Microbacterium elymi]UUT35816.1 hypothetical protein L2X98_21785 [Microbacterium elymi]
MGMAQAKISAMVRTYRMTVPSRVSRFASTRPMTTEPKTMAAVNHSVRHSDAQNSGSVKILV